MSTTIVLVRHGETDLSQADYFCGTTDAPLNDAGREMARAVARRMAGQRWSALYSSPLLRTRQTAEIIAAESALTVLIEPNLREVAYGEWEGRSAADVHREDRQHYERWAARPGTVAPPGGESGREVASRAVPVIEAMVRRHPDEAMLVVSHKCTIRAILCSVLGIDIDLFRSRIGAPVSSVAVIEFRDTGPLLALLGDTSHLPESLRGRPGT